MGLPEVVFGSGVIGVVLLMVPAFMERRQEKLDARARQEKAKVSE